MPDPPADPLNVVLTVAERGWAWRVVPQMRCWHASADVEGDCDERVRHVGDVAAWMVWPDPVRVDPPPAALEYVLATVFEPTTGQLHPELDQLISPSNGVTAVLIITEWELTPPWRGMDLAGLMLSATVERWRSQVRLAVCRISPTRVHMRQAEAAASTVRAAAILDRYGWQRWRGLHVIDTRSDVLVDATFDVMQRGEPG
jgi:hypothetical protein